LVLLIAALGYLVYLSDPVSAELPSAVALSQLLYYPLLVSIVWQIQPKPALVRQDHPLPASPQMAEAFLELNLQTEQEQIRNALTHSLSIFSMSDLFGLVQRTPEGSLRVSNSYDLIREAWLPAFELTSEQVPQLAAHFEDGLPLSSNIAEELAEEKAALIQAIGYNTSGCLLLYPLIEGKKSQNTDCSALPLIPTVLGRLRINPYFTPFRKIVRFWIIPPRLMLKQERLKNCVST
jgi:hypothetical protein